MHAKRIKSLTSERILDSKHTCSQVSDANAAGGALPDPPAGLEREGKGRGGKSSRGKGRVRKEAKGKGEEGNR